MPQRVELRAWSSIAQSVCQRAFSLLAIWCLRSWWVRILLSAEEDNLSLFDSNIACLCQSIEINNNKYVYCIGHVRWVYAAESGVKRYIFAHIRDNIRLSTWNWDMLKHTVGTEKQGEYLICDDVFSERGLIYIWTTKAIKPKCEIATCLIFCTLINPNKISRCSWSSIKRQTGTIYIVISASQRSQTFTSRGLKPNTHSAVFIGLLFMISLTPGNYKCQLLMQNIYQTCQYTILCH